MIKCIYSNKREFINLKHCLFRLCWAQKRVIFQTPPLTPPPLYFLLIYPMFPLFPVKYLLRLGLLFDTRPTIPVEQDFPPVLPCTVS